MFWRRWSIARRLFSANLVFVLLLAAGVATVMVYDAGNRTYEQTRERVLSIATVLADSPAVLDATASADPSIQLQPYALAVMTDANLDFVTIMSPRGIRWTHPNPAEISKPYVGSIRQAQMGQSYTEVTAGTLGPSVRAIVPIKDSAGTVQGMVAAGVRVSNVQVLVAAGLPGVLGLALALLISGSMAAWFLGRYLKRVTLGWGPEELAHLFAYYESVLHSVREGLVLVDTGGSLVLYNDHAALLLGIDPASDQDTAPLGSKGKDAKRRSWKGSGDHESVRSQQSLRSLELPYSLKELLRTGRVATDEVHVAGKRLLVVSQRPAIQAGNKGSAGSVVTLRDHTELTSLAGHLSSTQTLVTALRSQTHEHANRLHAIISLIELDRAREALDFATSDLSDTVRLGEQFVGTLDDPFLTALLQGKISQAQERGVRLELSGSGTLPTGMLDARELVTILGNLVDNGIEAAAGCPDATVWADLLVAEGTLTVTVADNGPGLATTALDELARIGVSSKQGITAGGHGFGLALVRRAVAALGGTLRAENDAGAVLTAVVPLTDRNSNGQD